MMKSLKADRAGRYRALWIDVADMHAYAHALYAGHGLFYFCLLQPCAVVLQRKHIQPMVRQWQRRRLQQWQRVASSAPELCVCSRKTWKRTNLSTTKCLT
jgi:hypothetical protein